VKAHTSSIYSVIQLRAGVKVLINDENDGDTHITAAVDCGKGHWEKLNKNA